MKPKYLLNAILLIACLFLPSRQTLAATFQGLKFNDFNGNGVKDADEQALANHTIYLKNNDLDSLYTLTTDASGFFISGGHSAANYTLWTDIPAGSEQTTPVAGAGIQYYTIDANQNDTLDVNLGVRETIFTSCNEVTEIPQAQCNTLVTLYDSTDGDNWTNKAGWKQINTPCSWYGVTCSVGEVTRLELYENNLTGSLPALSVLTQLEKLALSKNQLTGPIPELSALTKLEEIYLHTNQLTGPIPELSALTNLRELYLNINQLSGPIPELSTLTNLQSLALSENELSGVIPALTTLTNLKALYLQKNQLTGSIPDLSALVNLEVLNLLVNQLTGPIPALSTLTNLRILYLHTNKLTGSIPDLSALTQLEKLWLADNQLTGTIPELSALTNLMELYLHINQLSGTIPDLSALTNLEEINLNGNQLTGSIPDLSALINLEVLSFPSNQLSGPIPDLSALTNLRYLNLNDNQLTGVIPDLTALTQLEKLWLSKNQLTGPIPDVSGATNLQYLYLQDNTLTGEIPSWINTLTQLERLYFDDNALTGSIPALSSLTQLVHLTFNNNPLTGAIPDLAALTNLETLGLSGTQLCQNPNYDYAGRPEVDEFPICSIAALFCANVTEIPQAQCQTLVNLYDSTNGDNWTNKDGWKQTNTPCSWYGVSCENGGITEIDLKENNLIGTLPNLSALTSLEIIALHSLRPEDSVTPNKLTGNIPDLSALTNLQTLNLAYNQLTGPIPALSALTHLVWLALHNNQLTGSIPDLSALTHLEVLNLQLNQLSGPIPVELSALTQLRILALNQNQLTGTIPDLSALTKLEGLTLGANQLTGPILELSTLTNLERLTLHQNQLTGTIPDLSALTKLERLALAANQLTGPIPELNALSHLVWLSLRYNQLSGPIPELSALTQLETLYLDNNQLSGPIPELSALTNLKALGIENNQLTGPIPDLRSATNLQYLSVHSNTLTGEIPPWINTLTQLERLYFDDNALTGSIPALSSLTQLVNVTFNNNPLTGAIPDLAALTNLATLGLSGTQVCQDSNANYGSRTEVDEFLGCDDFNYGVVLNLPFDGNANDTIGDNNGTVNGATLTTDRHGNADNAYNFDGDDDIQFDSSVQDQPPFSVSLWFKSDSIPENNGYLMANGGESLPSQGFAFVLAGRSNPVSNSYPDGAIVFGAKNQTLNQQKSLIAPITLGQWHQITGVWDKTGSTLLLYVDGQLVSASDSFNSVDDFGPPRNLRIGGPSNNDLDYAFQGQIDDVLIHNRALSASEIQAHYDSTAPFAGCNTVTEIPTAQCDALVALYDNTDGAQWTQNAGWKMTNAPCSWYGVSCDNGITDVDLMDNNLTGTVPDLSHLTSLQRLNLNDNQLKGSFPDLSALTRMKELYLRLNQLSGPLPSDLSTFTNLVALDVGGNQLSGPIPALSGLTNLQNLWLYSNQFTGAIPDLPASLQGELDLSGDNHKLCKNPGANYAGRAEVDAFPICGTQAPEAVITISEPQEQSDGGMSVRIDGSGSTDSDPDGQITSYTWITSEGQIITGTDPTPTITFSEPGNKTVTLVIGDNTGKTTAIEQTITVAKPVEIVSLIVNKQGTGLGEFRSTSPDTAIDCDTDCKQARSDYNSDQVVTLEAIAAAGSRFIGWSKGCGGTTNPTTVRMYKRRYCTITFELDPTQQVLHRVRLAKIGDGQGSIAVKQDGKTITTCTTADCEAKYYAPGTELTLIAKARDNALFIGWGEECSGTEPTLVVTIEKATQCSAIFQLPPPPPSEYRLTVAEQKETQSPSTGIITGSGIECSQNNEDCAENYSMGTLVRLEAKPMPHSHFKEWTEDCSGTNPVVKITMDADKNCTAIFGSDSDLNAQVLVDEIQDVGELFDSKTGQSQELNDVFPITYNETCFQEAYRLAENAMQVVEEQYVLSKSWPAHFKAIENWFDPSPDYFCTKLVRIMSGAANLGGDIVEGEYIQVDVELRDSEQQPEMVSILVYYGAEPTITEASTKRRCCRRKIKHKK